jgi:outer membrane protein TolC
LTLRHTVSVLDLFESINATDFQYGLSARYTLPRLNTTLSADGNMYSRRGYGSPDLNTDDFVLNASVNQPFFKGKLIARIEAFDLLHQLSNTQYSVNAQGRTETWYRVIPNYVMLRVAWQFNKYPKKK